MLGRMSVLIAIRGLMSIINRDSSILLDFTIPLWDYASMRNALQFREEEATFPSYDPERIQELRNRLAKYASPESTDNYIADLSHPASKT